jgi:hypothetical protein
MPISAPQCAEFPPFFPYNENPMPNGWRKDGRARIKRAEKCRI